MKQVVLCVVSLLVLSGCCAAQKAKPKTPPVELLSGNMDQWEPIIFGGEGDVLFKDGAMDLDYGNPLTGVLYKGDLADLFGEDLENYAITLQAQRVEGVDMFAAVTFPVGKDGHVSLILGGWAGAITGLSNLDGLNASENDTTQFHNMPEGQWFKVKIMVTSEKIQCWLDDKQLVDVKRADYKKFDTHAAVVDTKPFGLFNYSTWGRVKDVRVWKLN
ncbi:MAG: family 16 glycoside hydrolase [Phycisphaeraceae bacterium]